MFVRGRAYLCVHVAEQDFRDCCRRCHAAQWQEAVGGYGKDYGRVRLDRGQFAIGNQDYGRAFLLGYVGGSNDVLLVSCEIEYHEH